MVPTLTAAAEVVVFSGTAIAGDADRRRTWVLLGEPAGRAASELPDRELPDRPARS